VIPVESHEGSIVDAQGYIVGSVLTFRDITERKVIELERERLMELALKARIDAETASEQRLRFLGMVSHELRSPLTAVKGFSSTLLAEDVEWSPEDLRQFYKVIDDEANKMSSLIGNLLEVSRLQAHAIAVTPERITIASIFQSAKAQLTILTQNHYLETNIPPDLPLVLADKQRVAQVIVNLVDNAVKYSPKHTNITVSVETIEGFVQINVADEGKGISPEERDKVFEAFHQLENRGTTRKGVGLGLAICKELVEAHGGKIWVQDCPIGTTISFTVPATFGDPGSEANQTGR
jgi:signal transduction histidine kinase